MLTQQGRIPVSKPTPAVYVLGFPAGIHQDWSADTASTARDGGADVPLPLDYRGKWNSLSLTHPPTPHVQGQSSPTFLIQ